MKNWDKILDDFARKCKGGSPDMTNPRHLALLRESLIKFGWNENATNEFIGNLREAKPPKTNPWPTKSGKWRGERPDGSRQSYDDIEKTKRWISGVDDEDDIKAVEGTEEWPEPKEGSGKNRNVREDVLNGKVSMASVGRNTQKDGILGMQGDETSAGKGGTGGYFNETQFGASFTEMGEGLKGPPSKKWSEMTADERQRKKDDWKQKKRIEAREVLHDEVEKSKKKETKACKVDKKSKECNSATKKRKYLEGRQKQIGYHPDNDPRNIPGPNKWIDKKLESAAGGIDELGAMEQDPHSDFDMDNQPKGYPVLTTMNEEAAEGMRASLEKQSQEMCNPEYVKKNGDENCNHAKHEIEKFEKQVIGSQRSDDSRAEGKADTAIVYYDSKGRMRIKYVNNKESENDIQDNKTVASRKFQMEEVVEGKVKEVEDDESLTPDEKKKKIEKIRKAAKESDKIDDNAVEEANQMNKVFSKGVRSVIDSEGITAKDNMKGLASHITARGEKEDTSNKYLKNALKKGKSGNPVREGVKEKPEEVAKALGKTWIKYIKDETQIALIKKIDPKKHIPLTSQELSNLKDNPKAMKEMFEEIDNVLTNGVGPPTSNSYNQIGDIIAQAALDAAGKEGQEGISDNAPGSGNKLIMKILRTSRAVRTKLETRACRKVKGTIDPATGKCSIQPIPPEILQEVAKKMEGEGFFGGMSAQQMADIYNDKKLEKIEQEFERRNKAWEEVHGRIVDNHRRLDIVEHLEESKDSRSKEASSLNKKIQEKEQRLRDIREAQDECSKTPPPKSVKVGKSKLKCENLAAEKEKAINEYQDLERQFDELVADIEPLDDNGTHTQVFVRSFMDGMGWTDYIENEDGEESKNMGGTPYQPKDIRDCLGELSNYSPPPEPPHPPVTPEVKDWRKKLIEHLEKELRVDSDSGAVTFNGTDGRGDSVEMGTDSWRTAGDEGKVEGKLGKALKDCLKEKGKKYKEQQPPKEKS